MKLSDKMPAAMDSQLAAKMPATQPSEAKATGGGSMMPTTSPIARDSQGGEWQANGRKNGDGWTTNDVGSKGWE